MTWAVFWGFRDVQAPSSGSLLAPPTFYAALPPNEDSSFSHSSFCFFLWGTSTFEWSFSEKGTTQLYSELMIWSLFSSVLACRRSDLDWLSTRECLPSAEGSPHTDAGPFLPLQEETSGLCSICIRDVTWAISINDTTDDLNNQNYLWVKFLGDFWNITDTVCYKLNTYLYIK